MGYAGLSCKLKKNTRQLPHDHFNRIYIMSEMTAKGAVNRRQPTVPPCPVAEHATVLKQVT
jgi:hypothetical protein